MSDTNQANSRWQLPLPMAFGNLYHHRPVCFGRVHSIYYRFQRWSQISLRTQSSRHNSCKYWMPTLFCIWAKKSFLFKNLFANGPLVASASHSISANTNRENNQHHGTLDKPAVLAPAVLCLMKTTSLNWRRVDCEDQNRNSSCSHGRKELHKPWHFDHIQGCIFFFFFWSGLLLGLLKLRTYCCSSVQPLVGKGTLLWCKTWSPAQGIGFLRRQVWCRQEGRNRRL